MRIPALFIMSLTTALACADAGPAPVEPELLEVPAFSRAAAAVGGNFRAHTHGGEEVPAVETRAQGQAIFQLSADGESLSYKLIVANVEDVLMSHIHMAAAGTNGQVVVWLYPSAPPPILIPGRSQGVLAEGVIDASSLVGPLAGMDLDDLIDAIRSRNAYVNVHTAANPLGEVRGQIH
jgi:hypothetical protein